MKSLSHVDPMDHDLPHEHASWMMKNQLIELMANDVKNRNLDKIGSNECCGVSGDETADVSNNVMLSVVCRTVNIHFYTDEVLSGLHAISNKKMRSYFSTMCNYIYSPCLRSDGGQRQIKPYKKCTSQGYDGARNMMGTKIGASVTEK